MKPVQHSGLPKSLTFGGQAFLSRIFEILDTGDSSKGLKIAVSLVGQKSFLYFNASFKKLVGDKIDELTNRGWDFWFENVGKKEVLRVKNRIRHFFSNPFDRKSLTIRYHMFNGAEDFVCLRHEMVLHELENCTMLISYFFDVSQRERIEHCMQSKKRPLDTNFNTNTTFISPREEEVLRLVADGHSSKQIADMLYISNHTAITHRKHLIEKFRVKNTAQLIKKASRSIEL